MQPAVHPTTAILYRSLGTGLTEGDEEAEWHLLLYLDGPGELLGELDDLVRDSEDGPGWSAPFDVDRAAMEQLPWLGQLVGVRIPEGLTLEEARDWVQSTTGWHRGTPAAIKAAARATLVAPKKVNLVERDTSPYRLRVQTYAIQTPDPAATEAAVRAQKPAGLVMFYDLLPGEPWSVVRDTYATWQDVKDDFATWDDLREWIAP